MRTFDVHCHLYDRAFDKDLDSVIKRAKSVLFGALNAGENPDTNRKVIELTKKYEGFCFASLGIHPTEIHKFSDEQIEAEVKWIKKQRPLAIAEVGLDYAVIRRSGLGEPAKARQIKWFENFLQLAYSLNVPAVIHSRWATGPVVKILEELRPQKAVLHAFSGTLKEAERVTKLGYKISIGNTISYAEQKRKLVEKLPLEAFCLESDSPALGLVKGQRNEPSNISLTVREIAKIKNVSESKVSELSNLNVKELFRVQPI